MFGCLFAYFKFQVNNPPQAAYFSIINNLQPITIDDYILLGDTRGYSIWGWIQNLWIYLVQAPILSKFMCRIVCRRIYFGLVVMERAACGGCCIVFNFIWVNTMCHWLNLQFTHKTMTHASIPLSFCRQYSVFQLFCKRFEPCVHVIAGCDYVHKNRACNNTICTVFHNLFCLFSG